MHAFTDVACMYVLVCDACVHCVLCMHALCAMHACTLVPCMHALVDMFMYMFRRSFLCTHIRLDTDANTSLHVRGERCAAERRRMRCSEERCAAERRRMRCSEEDAVERRKMRSQEAKDALLSGERSEIVRRNGRC